jgi:hypothetical protein
MPQQQPPQPQGAQTQPQQPPQEEVEDDDDDAVYFNADLFTNKATTLKTYSIDGLSQPLLASSSSTTDHDLTGQIVWPVSIFLAWFVARHRWRFDGQQVRGYVHVGGRLWVGGANDGRKRVASKSSRSVNRAA